MIADGGSASDATPPIVVASNRGPVQFELGTDGEPTAQRGSGGLVTALTGVVEASQGVWLSAAMTDGDRAVAASSPDGRVDLSQAGLAIGASFVDIAPDTYDSYYNGIANGVLWFVHHYLWETPVAPTFTDETERAWHAYTDVNRTFADALAEQRSVGSAEPVYLVQDYHLALVPRMLRSRRPGALIAHFSHTPFAGPMYLRILPTRMREELLRGMLGADVLGFHSQDWAENFLTACRGLPGARVDLARSRVFYEARETLVRVHPVSVDPRSLRAEADSAEVRERRKELRSWLGDARLLLRVDRLELTKNILRGFQAWELLLDRESSWRGGVRFLALLSPSRQELPEYQAYTEACLAEAERINARLGTKEWQPIDVRVRDDYEGALAAYGLYDALLVNPIIDGMNLVAMEGPVLNRRHGVLALSRHAGAFGRLGRYALGLNPFDVSETAAAIREALTMPEQERARRARGMSRLVLANPPERWVTDQLRDLEVALRRRART